MSDETLQIESTGGNAPAGPQSEIRFETTESLAETVARRARHRALTPENAADVFRLIQRGDLRR